MAFQQGLSGLNSSSRALDVISNNVANASTVGFKSSYAVFADIYASMMTGGVSSNQVGNGVTVNAVNQSFTQGNPTPTGNPLDFAIRGEGFFRMQQFDGTISYTRNGQFDLDKNGYVIDSSGYFLTGFDVVTQNAGQSVFAGVPTPLRVETDNMPPQATQDGVGASGYGATISVNLDSREDVPSSTPFDPANVTSYNDTTSMTVYDSLGNPHTMSIYFVRQTPLTDREWDVYAQLDGDPATLSATPFTLEFDPNGIPTSATNLMPVSFPVSTGATDPLDFTVDLSKTTQFGSEFAIYKLSQVGYTTGELAGLAMTNTGIVQGRYTNGLTKDIGQVALAAFPSNQGLISLGNNQWAESADSGQPIVGAPGSGVLGQVRSGEIEESNVDLTKELVNMIIQQRNYQANAQTIRTQDQVLQTLVNLR
jgi:flagellar hook protein FlgE